MTKISPTSHRRIWHAKEKGSQVSRQTLIREEPLSIRVQGEPYAVVMRTPGDEIAHVAGFCLAEGIVDYPEEIKNISFCDGEESNVVTVTLTPQRHARIIPQLDRRSYVSQTSCGLCGKELISDIQQAVTPIKDTTVFTASDILTCLDELPAIQPLRNRTRAAHAAALYDNEMKLVASAEDVGRHNALDKAVGKLFLKNLLTQATLLILSSRISYELVQKAARANIAVIAAYSQPTELAVDLAADLGMTLACPPAKDTGLLVFCHGQRVVIS